MTSNDGEAAPRAGHPATAPAAVLRRLPGKARPREEALREYQDFNAKLRKRIPSALWQFWAPDPDQFYRWRVQLGCGCIPEILTPGNENPPHERQWLDHVHKARLPKGQLLCSHDDSPPAPYRDISEWGDRREMSFPADPVEPPDWADAQTWALIRHDGPRTAAFWRVTLSCGHVTEVSTDLDWKPADGARRVGAKRQREMNAEFEEFWAADPCGQEDREREHTKRMLAQGWPRPQPEELCYTCPRARFIAAYQRVGWLVPRKPKPKPPKPPSRDSLERRLRQAEADVERLRDQLAQLDAREAPRPPAEATPSHEAT